ncbi:MAG TPA: hypothetical protein VM686_09725 [Polyangiaceae bacterium]|nr:hypothetical protein [Polyangiaceae bacterium]
MQKLLGPRGFAACSLLLALTLGGCSESASPPGPGGAAGSSTGSGATGNTGAGGANGGSSTGGSGATGGGTAGIGGSVGGSSVGGTSGAGGTPSGAPTSVSIATHDVGVDNLGTVFNVADNYFRDYFIPATPVANFGLHSQIIAVPNDDGSIDVAWLDYTSGDESPWALEAPGMIYITHVDAALATATTQASGISSYKLLGFAKDATGAVYLAYNKDHALKSGNDGDENNLNGNELHVTKLVGGAPQWDQLIFGDQDNNAEDSLGDPAGAASSVLGYDATNQRLVIYCGHSMMWGGVRHQAGFLRILNPDSGAVLPPAGDDIIHFGAGWWYSHNFNQRLIIDGGDYYVLAHGDAYARQLGFGKWSLDGYSNDNSTDFDESYWTIGGGEGDNNTNAQTGQFVRMSDGRFAMVHTSSEGRGARDVRVVTADGASGTADEAGAVWLTQNQGDTHATISKVELLGDYLLVTYALWDGEHALTWYSTLLDATLQTVLAPAQIPGVEFVDSAPLFRFAGGPNAGNVGWVSGNATHTLSVGVASLAY